MNSKTGKIWELNQAEWNKEIAKAEAEWHCERAKEAAERERKLIKEH